MPKSLIPCMELVCAAVFAVASFFSELLALLSRGDHVNSFSLYIYIYMCIYGGAASTLKTLKPLYKP